MVALLRIGVGACLSDIDLEGLPAAGIRVTGDECESTGGWRGTVAEAAYRALGEPIELDVFIAGLVLGLEEDIQRDDGPFAEVQYLRADLPHDAVRNLFQVRHSALLDHQKTDPPVSLVEALERRRRLQEDDAHTDGLGDDFRRIAVGDFVLGIGREAAESHGDKGKRQFHLKSSFATTARNSGSSAYSSNPMSFLSSQKMIEPCSNNFLSQLRSPSLSWSAAAIKDLWYAT